MKWGERRYQNYDGTLTQAGKERYQISNKLSQRINAIRSGISAQEDAIKRNQKQVYINESKLSKLYDERDRLDNSINKGAVNYFVRSDITDAQTEYDKSLVDLLSSRSVLEKQKKNVEKLLAQLHFVNLKSESAKNRIKSGEYYIKRYLT